jgi:hypothetical protein
MGNDEELRRILEEHMKRMGYVGGIYLASLDGLLITHVSKLTTDPDRVAAMIASISAVGDRVSKDLLDEEVDYVVVHGTSGYMIVKQYGNVVLGILTRSSETNVGLILVEMDKLIERIRRILP